MSTPPLSTRRNTADVTDALVDVGTGVRLHYRRVGQGEPLLLVMGTAARLGMWMPVEATFAERYDVISFDSRGLGQSDRGDGAMNLATLADDAAGLLDALSIPRAHVIGWSLGSTIVQELALRHASTVGSLVLYGTWCRRDGFATALMTALKHPWETGDVETAFVSLGVVYSPEFLDSPEFEKFVEWTTPIAPSTPKEIRAVAEQWRADLDFDSFDRVGAIAAPTLVLTGEHDIVTPPRLGRAVAERIQGATFELITGVGASHGLLYERTDDFLRAVLTFLDQHPL
jgi:pimeloyl-ACP methyl ester carboxylesterase